MRICFDFVAAHFPVNPAARIASGTLKTPSHCNTSLTAFATRGSSARRFPPFPDMLVTLCNRGYRGFGGCRRRYCQYNAVTGGSVEGGRNM